MKKYLSETLSQYFSNLDLEIPLPGAIKILNPYKSAEVQEIVRIFYTKYYHDNNPRISVFGINPGRLGAGMTGISFTDPVRLKQVCGIDNSFSKIAELSSIFIYEVIEKLHGAEEFFSKYLLTSVCPLGFTGGGKNINYYDSIALAESCKSFMLQNLSFHAANNFLRNDYVICLGESSNLKWLTAFNKQNNFFGKIISLPHPRWVMQYKRKRKQEFVEMYCRVLENTCAKVN